MNVNKLRETFANCLGGLDDETEVRLVLDCDQSGYWVSVQAKTGDEWAEINGFDVETDPEE